MDTNTIYEAFTIEGGRTHFYRWDLDQKIIVNDPDIDEVHFCNGTTDKSLVSVVKDGKANVPNLLLQTAARVRVYGYSVNHTRAEKIYEVKDRTKPDDYVYEETEVMRWAELDKRIQAIEEAAEPEEWEEIVSQSILPYTASQTLNIDATGYPFKLKKCAVEVEYAGEEEGRIILTCGAETLDGGWLAIAKAADNFTPDKKYARLEVYPNNGYWDMTYYGASGTDEVRPVYGAPMSLYRKIKAKLFPHIVRVRIAADNGTSLVPEGTVIRILGVRATE